MLLTLLRIVSRRLADLEKVFVGDSRETREARMRRAYLALVALAWLIPAGGILSPAWRRLWVWPRRLSLPKFLVVTVGLALTLTLFGRTVLAQGWNPIESPFESAEPA